MKYLLAVILLFGASVVKAAPPGGWTLQRSSFSASAQGVTLFSSAAISFDAIMVSSPVANGRLVIYRSTSSTFALDVSSQIVINTNTNVLTAGPQTFPLYGITNTSYTYIQKLGASETVIFFKCVGDSHVGNCPGLTWNAQK